MKRNAKVALYVMVLLGGGGWLLADQLAKPAEAGASTDDAAVAVAARPAAATTAAAGAASGPSLRTRLEAAYRTNVADAALDPFDTPTARHAVVATPASTAAAAELPVGWRLSGIVRHGEGRGVVLIDGVRVAVGQVFRGYRLVRLDAKRAIFRSVTEDRQFYIGLREE